MQLQETIKCPTCKEILYVGEGKKCQVEGCTNNTTEKQEVVFSPAIIPNEHIGIPIVKKLIIMLLVLFGGNIHAQDTICLPADRLARIADTLARASQFEGAYLQCDKLLEEQYQLTITKHEQMVLYKRNYALEQQKTVQLDKEAKAWKEAAESANKELILTNKKLNKARKARKTWMGGAIGAFGLIGAGTTAIILLTK